MKGGRESCVGEDRDKVERREERRKGRRVKVKRRIDKEGKGGRRERREENREERKVPRDENEEKENGGM